MKKLIYHPLTVTLSLAVAISASAAAVPSYADDFDEKCSPKPVVYIAFEGHEPDQDDRYVAVDKVPRLVGYRCKGSKGPLFANEEDHFPRCKAIEAWR